MINRIKTYLTLISLALAIIAGIYGFISNIQADNARMERDNAKDELRVKTTEIIRYINKLGNEVVKTISYEKKLRDLKTSNDSIERLLYKTIKASKIKEKQLKSAIIVGNETKGHGKYDSIVKIIKTDTISLNSISYFNDGYLNAICYPDSFTYVYNDTIIAVLANRLVDRKFFLWKWIKWKKTIDKELIEVTSSNPKSVLTIKDIKINE